MINDVARGSIGSQGKMRSEDLIISVDGKPATGPYKLCKYLKIAENSKKDVKFITQQNSWGFQSRTRYKTHEIKIQGVKLVGPEAPKGCGPL